MADPIKISALDAASSLASTDILPAVVDPGGTPITKKSTVAALMASLGLTGAGVANVAAANVIGGVPVLHIIVATTLTGDVDVVLTHKTRVLDVWCVGTAAGGAGDTITVKNGATAITDAIDMNVADKVVKRAGTIDDAQHEIAAAGTLKVSGASAVNAIVYVLGLRVA